MSKENIPLPPYYPSVNNPQQDDMSIVNVIGPEMAAARSGNILMDEMQVYGGLYQQKMLEKVDRNEIMNAGRRAAKLFIISTIVGGAANRLVTKAKFGKFDFLNMCRSHMQRLNKNKAETAK